MENNDFKTRRQILSRLFFSTLTLSAFTFGGGYVIVTLMKKTFVDKYHWIEEDEMLDLVAIAQSSPGPIAVNGAIVLGYELAGIAGVIIGVLATIIPPFLILSLIACFYSAFRSNQVVGWMLDGMQAGVGAVITQVVWEMASGIVTERQWVSAAVLIAAFLANFVFGVNVVLIILACGALGIISALIRTRGSRKGGAL